MTSVNVARMKIIFSLTLLAMYWQSALAKPIYFNAMRSNYPEQRLSFKCQACHRGGPSLTPFGHDFFDLKQQLGMNNLPQVWERLRDLDSDGDGLTNEQEILQDQNPGKAGE